MKTYTTKSNAVQAIERQGLQNVRHEIRPTDGGSWKPHFFCELIEDVEEIRERGFSCEHTPLKGLRVKVFRDNGPDCSNMGLSATETDLMVIGPGIPEVFEVRDGDAVVELVQHRTMKHHCYLKPYGDDRWLMFGGNFAYTSDSRFSEAVEALTGHHLIGAVPIHDRYEG